MVFVPPYIHNGQSANEHDHNMNEDSADTVTLTRGFWIGKYEVTQGDISR